MNSNNDNGKVFLGGWKGLIELIPNNADALLGAFSSLHSRNYRLYFYGQWISLIGTFIQQIALSWLVYRLTGSVLLLASVTLAAQLPSFFLTPVTGVLIDRFDRYKLLIVTQSLYMLQATILAALVMTNHIEVWHIMTLSLLVGIISAFDMPARHSFTVQLVERKEDLSNAIALNSAIFNAARLIGPSIGGILIGIIGEGMCFTINAVSYIAVLSSFFRMRVVPLEKRISKKSVVQEMNEGISYALHSFTIRSILLMVTVISFFGFSLLVILPAFAKDTLGGNSDTLGYMMSSIGAGALVAALYLAARKSVIGLGKVIMISTFILGAGITILAFTKIPAIAYLACFPIGFSLIASVASLNTQLQTISQERMRGRVMSFYTMALMGVSPIGGMMMGLLEKWLGIPMIILLNGIVCIIAAFLYERHRPMLRKHMRRIYVEKGIIPEIATGIESVNGK